MLGPRARREQMRPKAAAQASLRAGSRVRGGGSSEVTDCDDGLWCNGLESCSEGTCVGGAEPCQNIDPEYCQVTCEESSGGPRCLSVALDIDEDGYGTTQCEANPGEDCDDARPEVNPGVVEFCDGTDSDCNGLIDVDDGVAINVTETSSAYGNDLDLAYLPGEGAYGLAYLDLESRAMFRSYSADGAVLAEPVALSSELVSVETNRGILLVPAGEQFMALYETDEGGGTLQTQMVTAQGFIDAPAALPVFETFGHGSGLSELDDGQVAVIWQNALNSSTIRRIGTDGSTIAEHVFASPSPVAGPRLTSVGETLAFTWTDAVSTQLGIFDDNFAPLTRVPISESSGVGSHARTEAKPMGDGFALISVSDDALPSVEYAEYEIDGNLRCGPMTVHPPSLLVFRHLDVHAGTAAIYVSDPDGQYLIRVRENCEAVGAPVVFQEEFDLVSTGAVDINETGVAIATSSADFDTLDRGTSLRIMGPNLCDEPSPAR